MYIENSVDKKKHYYRLMKVIYLTRMLCFKFRKTADIKLYLCLGLGIPFLEMYLKEILR